LALSMRNIRPPDVNFISAPVAGLGRSPDGAQSIVELDFDALDEVSQAFIEDRSAEFVEDNPDLVQLGEDVE
ncbi:MAG TPA: LytR family transcriptional regulator, partial [Beutenbergiaceae bacterium]|nr:LytR family transcriptional regulator [Beutenbergiaceae bacterium]